jgi:hypothetical protein
MQTTIPRFPARYTVDLACRAGPGVGVPYPARVVVVLAAQRVQPGPVSQTCPYPPVQRAAGACPISPTTPPNKRISVGSSIPATLRGGSHCDSLGRSIETSQETTSVATDTARRGVTLVTAVATLKATRVTAGEMPQWLINKTIVACCNPALNQVSGLTAGEKSVTQLALEEIKVMNGQLLSKPMAIVASITTAATFMVGVQLAVSHSPTNDSTGSPLLLPQTSDHQAPVSSTEATTFQSAKLIHSAPSKDRTLNTSDAVKTVSNSSPIVKHTATYDLMPRTTSEMKIYQALDLPLVAPLEYTDVPLLEILNILSDDYDVQILLDRRGMEDIGISGEVEVNMNVRNIQLKSALRLMLRELELTCIIRDEVLVITTQEVAESMLETRVYPTIHLSVRAEDLTDVIISTVAAGTWAENGNGEGQIKDVDNGLVILQTQSVYEEIQQLLGQLTKLQD